MGGHRPRGGAGGGGQGLIDLSDQLPLIGPRGGLRPRTPKAPSDVGGRRVDVLIESRLPHLGRTFTYSVPPRWDDRVSPGVRVRVRVGKQLLEGFVESDNPAYAGSVSPIQSVVSSVPVLSEQVLELCRAVATHYAGSVADVVRLAVPPRVANVEEGYAPARPVTVPQPPSGTGPADHPLVAAAAAGRPVRGAWSAPAGPAAPAQIAAAAVRVAAAGRGVILVVPDGRDVDRFAAELRALAGPAVAVLRADDAPGRRYAEFLSVLSGRTPIVIGTRAAAFAPVVRLGLLILWDDGDPSLAEQRAPYPHAREVLALRSHTQPCALLLAGHARTPEVQRWIDDGWLQDISDIGELRRQRPATFSTVDRVRSPFDPARRLPASMVAALREGLTTGPVLVQVARTGYVPLTACAQCRELAECIRCGGPLSLGDRAETVCRRCENRDPFRCPHCGNTRLRAVRLGARRTSEELGRMFPGVRIVQSTGEHPVDRVAGDPVIVVSTPGVEPMAQYAAAAFPDAQEDLWRMGVQAREDAARRWFNAAAMVSPGGPVALAADPADDVVQALIRWDPGHAARSELERRREAGLPPARQIAQVDGRSEDLADLQHLLGGDGTVEILGPRPLGPTTSRLLIGAPDFAALRDRIRQWVLARAAAHRGSPVRVQIDPPNLD